MVNTKLNIPKRHNMKLLYAFFVFSSLLVYAEPLQKTERGINCSLMIDAQDPLLKSKIDFSPCFLIPNGSNLIMISPRASLYYSQTFDLNFGIGYRIPFEAFTFGSHIFWDFTQANTCFLFQNGISFEFLSNTLDAHFNYYHPMIVPLRTWDNKIAEK